MSPPLVVTGRVVQCLRVLRFVRVELTDGRMAFLYVHDGEVAAGDDLFGEDLVFIGRGRATNLTRGDSLAIEVTHVQERGEVPGLHETLLLG